MRFVDREFVKQPHTNRGDESSNIDNEKEFRQQIESEFEPSYELMIDPSLLASEPKSSQLQDSRILHDEGIRLSVPQSLTSVLTDLDKYDVRQRNVISEFAGQAQQASREQILAIINENSIREFSYRQTNLEVGWESDFTWERAFNTDELDDYEYVQQTLSDEFAYLVTSSKLLAIISYAVDRLRDAGVQVVDIGKAQLEDSYESVLQDIYHPELAKFCVFSVANNAPFLIDPVFAVIVQSSVDFTLYKIDA